MKVNDWIKARINKKAPVIKKAETAVPRSAFEVIKEESVLNKSQQEEKLNCLLKDHSDEQEKMVEVTYHYVNSNVSKEYKKSIKDGSYAINCLPELEKGICSKIIHKVGNDCFMTKPYFSGKDRPVPLSGWASMTTKNLYEAADLKDFIEDISTFLLQTPIPEKEIMVTVHRFANDYTTASCLKKGGPEPVTGLIGNDDITELTKPKDFETISDIYNNIHEVNPLVARQIGIMDWLTGNYDRHGNNLLVADKKEGKYRGLIAIDHDRSFNYLKVSSPHDEYKKSAMSRVLGDYGSQASDDTDKDLAYWWNKNKDTVYKEMNRNLTEIKDNQLRKYVRRNFDHRYEQISTWASSYNNFSHSFFEQAAEMVTTSYPLGKADSDSIKQLKESLPKDKSTAINMLVDYMKKPRSEFSPTQFHAIQSVALDLLMEMPAKELVGFFAKADFGDRIKAFKNDILMDMKKNLKGNLYKIETILKANSDLPKDTRFLNSFWDLHLAKTIKEFKARSEK